MALKHHPIPLSGGDRKALNKELGKSRAMANIFLGCAIARCNTPDRSHKETCHTIIEPLSLDEAYQNVRVKAF